MNYKKYFKLLLFVLITLLSACAPMNMGATLVEQQEARELIDKGTAHLREYELEDAQAAFSLAVELAELPAAYDGLGCVALLAGEYKIAEQYFVYAYNKDENYKNALGNLAYLYEIRGFKIRARQLYLAAIEENPGNFRFRNNFAAFLVDDKYSSSRSVDLTRAKTELFKAQALFKHKVISDNLKQLGVN